MSEHLSNIQKALDLTFSMKEKVRGRKGKRGRQGEEEEKGVKKQFPTHKKQPAERKRETMWEGAGM